MSHMVELLLSWQHQHAQSVKWGFDLQMSPCEPVTEAGTAGVGLAHAVKPGSRVTCGAQAALNWGTIIATRFRHLTATRHRRLTAPLIAAGYCVWKASAPGCHSAEACTESAERCRGASWPQAGSPASTQLVLGCPGDMALRPAYCFGVMCRLTMHFSRRISCIHNLTLERGGVLVSQDFMNVKTRGADSCHKELMNSFGGRMGSSFMSKVWNKALEAQWSISPAYARMVFGIVCPVWAVRVKVLVVSRAVCMSSCHAFEHWDQCAVSHCVRVRVRTYVHAGLKGGAGCNEKCDTATVREPVVVHTDDGLSFWGPSLSLLGSTMRRHVPLQQHMLSMPDAQLFNPFS